MTDAHDTGWSGPPAPGGDTPAPPSREEQLAEAAMDLLACRTEADVYDVIGDFLGLVAPGAVVIVNEATPRLDCFVTRKIAGMDDSLIAKAADLVGFDIIGKRSAISPALRAEMLGGRLRPVPGGFPELASSEIPRTLGEVGAKLFGFMDVYTIGIADKERTLGNIHIIMRTASTALPSHVIESFARHCYSALESIRKGRELAESAERNEQLLGSMSEGLALHEMIYDRDATACDYRFLAVNPAFETMTGMRTADVVGRTVRELLPSIEQSWIDRYAEVAATGIPSRFEEYNVDLDRHFSVAAYSPRRGQFASLISDITASKRAEAELQRLNESLEDRVAERTQELNAAVSELTGANEAKTRFLRSMSHELRTPLNSVIGFSSMLADGVAGHVNDEQKRQLQMINTSGKHLLTLINDILDLSRIEAGIVEVHVDRLDVAELLAELVDSVGPAAAEKGLSLELVVEHPTPELWSDRTKVRQILLNLLSNAIKFTEKGGVVLHAGRPAARLVSFSVSDTGPGIAPGDAEHVFGEFVRGDPQDPSVEGTGLGLAISRGLAASLGGTVDLASELDTGSTFTLTLPQLPVRQSTERTGA